MQAKPTFLAMQRKVANIKMQKTGAKAADDP